MDKRELICIGCPIGCVLCVEISHGSIVGITGNSCKIGEEYGIKECTSPTRVLTSTVEIIHGKELMLPIKTEKDVPKNKIQECMKALKEVKIKAPVNMGDIILKNVANTGVNLIATKSIKNN